MTATDGKGSGRASLTVTPGPLVSLKVSPASATIAAGGSQTYTAEGFDASGNDLGDVTSATTFAISGGGTCTGATCGAIKAGTDTVTATDGTATGMATLTVTPGPSTTKVTLSPNTAVVGQAFTANVAVSPTEPDMGTPTGTVTVTDTNPGGQTCTATLDNTGNGSCNLTENSPGSYTISAKYGGDSNFQASSASATEMINQGLSDTTVVSSANPSTFGTSVTFTATVGVQAPAKATPTGTVSFYSATTLLGTEPLVGTLTGAQAKFTTSALPAGTHQITAAYGGDAMLVGSTSPGLVQTVNQASQTITFPTPTGVTFGQADSDLGATASSNLAVSYTSSTTSVCTISATGQLHVVSAGTCKVTAGQPGDTNYLPAQPVPVSFDIAQASTTTVLTQSPSNPSFGQPVTLTASVSASPPGAGTPTGTVTFTDGTTTLGTVPLNTKGQASLTTELAAGPHAVVATYSGAANFAPSASPAQGTTVTVGCTQTITGNHPGSVVVSSGSTCLVNAQVTGSVLVESGGALDAEGSTISGSIAAQGALALRVCASHLGGSLSSTGAKGFVLIGGDADDSCAPNTITGSLVLRNNTAGLEAIGNTVQSQVVNTANSGPGPLPEDASPEVSGNGQA